jgi:hypothetical protein
MAIAVSGVLILGQGNILKNIYIFEKYWLSEIV